MDNRIEILKMIVEDMKADVKHYDGQAFNGRNVAEYFGKHGAAITALADIVASLLIEKETNGNTTVQPN